MTSQWHPYEGLVYFHLLLEKLHRKGQADSDYARGSFALALSRSLIGDALLVRNIEVIDIINEKTGKPHLLTSFAKVQGNRIVYPKEI